MTVQRRKQLPKEPRSSEEIRYLYLEQLFDAIQRLQDMWDEDLDNFLLKLSDEDRQKTWVQEMLARAAEDNNRCFEMELFDAGEPAFIGENVFCFRFPKEYVLTKATLLLLEEPDVVWAYPQVTIGLSHLHNWEDPRWEIENPEEWDDHLVIEVVLVDG